MSTFHEVQKGDSGATGMEMFFGYNPSLFPETMNQLRSQEQPLGLPNGSHEPRPAQQVITRQDGIISTYPLVRGYVTQTVPQSSYNINHTLVSQQVQHITDNQLPPALLPDVPVIPHTTSQILVHQEPAIGVSSPSLMTQQPMMNPSSTVSGKCCIYCECQYIVMTFSLSM